MNFRLNVDVSLDVATIFKMGRNRRVDVSELGGGEPK